jgi:hypothetical protein
MKRTLWVICGQCETVVSITGEMPLPGVGISWQCGTCKADNWFDPYVEVPEEWSREKVLRHMPPELLNG